MLLNHHGTRGAAAVAMGADGFQRIGKGGKPQKIHPDEWKCNPCSAGKGSGLRGHCWNWKKKTHCHVCHKPRPNGALLWGQTKPRKAELVARDTNGGGNAPTHGGKGGCKGGGKGGGDAEKIRKLEANNKRLEDELRKKKVAEAADAEDDGEEGDEEMDDDLKTKEDWDRVVVQAEADIKYVEEQLKKFPKSPRYLGIIEGARTQVDEAKEKLREFRSPSDQLQHKLNRERKLKIKTDKLKEGIKQHLVVIAEAEDELEVFREQLHEAQEEMQKIASQKILLHCTMRHCNARRIGPNV